jgi:hypothetical protein
MVSVWWSMATTWNRCAFSGMWYHSATMGSAALVMAVSRGSREPHQEFKFHYRAVHPIDSLIGAA